MATERKVLSVLLSLFFTSFFSLRLFAQMASFTLPDTVCTGSTVTINNTSTGGSRWYWNFCVADLSKTPVGTNLGNPGQTLARPVFMDIDSVNDHYYGFVSDNGPSGLIRMDFGNSLLNTPVATNMGYFGGAYPIGWGGEGVQIVHANGKWYVIVVGWDLPTVGTASRILKLDFGSDLGNMNPTITDWGNLGNMAQPIDLYLFSDADHWYGFTTNAENNTITRFDFGTSFDNPPVATNLGNPGGMLGYPMGICAVQDAGNWHVFITNNTRNLVRLDFGSSLLNTPIPADIGNAGGNLHEPRDITILKFCDQIIGYFVNHGTNDIVKLDFGSDLTNIPAATSFGNIGSFDFPHSLLKIFRLGADLYSFITNVQNNTITRLKFEGCNNSSISNSSVKDPPSIRYSSAGTYNINLMMDDGLASATTFCKRIVVMDPPVVSLGKDTTFCQGDSLILKLRSPPLVSYTWQDGSTADTFAVFNSGNYSLTAATSYGCSASAAVAVTAVTLPVVQTRTDTAICQGSVILLQTGTKDIDSLRWTPVMGLNDPFTASPRASPVAPMQYIVKGWHKQCPVSDTVLIDVLDTPRIQMSADTLICAGGMAQLSVTGEAPYQYEWSPAQDLSDPGNAVTMANPAVNTYYVARATAGNGCVSKDSLLVNVKKPDTWTIDPSPAVVCKDDSVLLTVRANEGAVSDTYSWLTDVGSQDPHGTAVKVSPPATDYVQVQAQDNICGTSGVITAEVRVKEKPVLSVTKSNDIDCIYGEAILTAAGGVRYVWSPGATLTDSTAASPHARTDTSTRYYVVGTGSNGCKNTDSVLVYATKAGGSIGFPVANAFTPNGDGNNDCWGIKYWGYIGEFEVSVFNRLGVRVYYSKDPFGCWDGRFSGQPQPSGTYVYIMHARALCGDAVRKGTLTLVR